MSHPSIAPPVARAVAALVGTGATLDQTTARQLLDSWQHRASLTPEQADQAARIASGGGPLPAATVAAVGRICELADRGEQPSPADRARVEVTLRFLAGLPPIDTREGVA